MTLRPRFRRKSRRPRRNAKPAWQPKLFVPSPQVPTGEPKRIRNCYNRKWNPVFSTDRHFLEDASWVESKRALGIDGRGIEFFLQDSESVLPSCQVEEVREYCQGVRLDGLTSHKDSSGRNGLIWLDDQSFFPGPDGRHQRQYGNPMTSATLYLSLKELRYGDEYRSDADRRLIYAENPDPYTLLALGETAAYHQTSALKDAMWKYIASQTSISVKIPRKGYLIFQLEFHIPYFGLRVLPRPEDIRRRPGDRKPERRCIDVDFLNIQPAKPKQYAVKEAQISFVACGSDYRRWTGWAFVDTDVDSNYLETESAEFDMDPIALGGEVEANRPIWDPREYFLMILENRIVQVRKEWEYLVWKVEQCVNQYRNQHQSGLSRYPEHTRCRAQNAKETFDWTQQTMDLLGQLQNGISKTIKAWDTFDSLDGDIGYFMDSLPTSSQSRAQSSLNTITEVFQVLRGFSETLLQLDKSCRSSAKVLQLRLNLESTESLQQNGFVTGFTTSVINPVVITIAYFSIPQDAVPFQLNSKSFLVAIIINIFVMRLLFVVACTIWRGSLWWSRAVSWVGEWRWHGNVDRAFPGRDGASNGLEMAVLEV